MARFIMCIVIASAMVETQCNLTAEDHPFPVISKFHCGGKARRSVPKAMGFSADSRILAIWYVRDLIIVEAATGKETARVRTADELSYASPYNYVAFDPTGSYCCIATVRLSGFDLQFFDVERGVGSELVNHHSRRHWTLESCYTSTRWALPLRQWLTIKEVRQQQANFEVLFPGSDHQKERNVHFEVSFNGDETLTSAEQKFIAMGGEKTIDSARKAGNYAGTGMQVALSQDGKTLLAQFIGRAQSNAWYRFRFYDVKTEKHLTEISLPTGIRSRHGVSRGFAFSPDFRRFVRSVPGGDVICHDLSLLADRKLDVSKQIEIRADYGTVDK